MLSEWGRKTMKRTFCFAAVLLLLLLLAACSGPNGSGEGNIISRLTDARYGELEIKEYYGIKLDPAAGLPENSISGIQTVDIGSYVLEVSGSVSQPVTLAYDEVLAMTADERMITLHCVEGWDATVLWKGALLKDIIDLAGARDTAQTVIFHCVDGYTSSLPLQAVRDKNMLLAYSANGITLPPSLGYPFIVVAEDKLGYKWARWVNKIEVSDNPYLGGYWEDRGFDNEAVVPTI
jgi:DMSO/TMAO reductase YedYZ molybdopterin-dependent catalytic subunit